MHAIRAAHAFDGERFLPGGATALVEDERIVGVEGPHHEPPEGCPLATYDGTLLPGLVDAHVHLIADASLMNLPRVPTYPPEQVDAIIADSLAAEAAAGVTTVRDLGDIGYRTLAFRDRAEPGVPRIVAAGPPLTEPEGHCHYLGGVVDGPTAVRAAIGERVERGVDVVKVMASGGMATDGSDVNGVQFGLDDLRLLADCAHEAGLRVLAHTHSLRGIRHAVAAAVDGLEHFTSLTDEGIHTPDEVLAEVAAAGVDVDPTLGSNADLSPPREQLPPNLRATFERHGLDPHQLLATRAEQLLGLRRHGIRVVSGTDAGVAPVMQHGSAWRAVVDLTVVGYPVAEALATATSVAADACGLGLLTGRLRAGLAADLLAVDGDVERDPAALSRPVGVWVRGVRL